MQLTQRNVSDLAFESLQDTPVTVITGARQVGKSTLMQQLLDGMEHRLVSLDSAVDREAAERDPDGFAAQFPQGTLAIDEIQRVPQLLTSIKLALDKDRKPGQFIITGSADLLSLQGAQESLAGRANTIPLEGFSQGELAGHKEDFAAYAWAMAASGQLPDDSELTRRDYLDTVVTSSYPAITNSSARAADRWMGSYIERILSKDARDIAGIQYPDRLERLLNVIAAQNASEFVAATIARSLDIPERSVPAYVRLLRQLFLIRELPAWSNNLTTKAVGRLKVVISDTGLAAFLCGVNPVGMERDISSTTTGGLVEGFVAGELARQRAWSNISYRIHHFRDTHGREVDLVLENRQREIVGIEVKAAATVTASDFKGLEFLKDKAGKRFVAGIVLYTGTRAVPFGDRLWALPISTLWAAQ